MFTVPQVEQVAISDPASTLGARTNVKVLFEVTLGQLVFEAVSVKITLPAVISAKLGV